MKNIKKENIIIIILIIVVITWTSLLYKQQKDTTNLEKSIKNLEKKVLNTTNTLNITKKVNLTQDSKNVEVVKKKIIKAFDQASETEKSIVNNTNKITGTIINISDISFIIKSSVIDISKLKDLDYSKSVTLQNIDKIYTVKFNNETKFVNINKEILKKWQIIDVTSKELVYKTDKLNAVEIKSFMNLLKK